MLFRGKKLHYVGVLLFTNSPCVATTGDARFATRFATRRGLGDGVSPGPVLRRERRRESQEINIVGMESLSSVFMPHCPRVAEETESAERDKAKYEASEARGRSTQALLTAISQAEKMEREASDEVELILYAATVKTLMRELAGTP